MYKEGLAEFEKALVIFPVETNALSGLGYAYVIAGRKAEAQKVLDQLNKFSKQGFVPVWTVAMIYVWLSEKDKVFEWLEKGLLGPLCSRSSTCQY